MWVPEMRGHFPPRCRTRARSLPACALRLRSGRSLFFLQTQERSPALPVQEGDLPEAPPGPQKEAPLPAARAPPTRRQPALGAASASPRKRPRAPAPGTQSSGRIPSTPAFPRAKRSPPALTEQGAEEGSQEEKRRLEAPAGRHHRWLAGSTWVACRRCRVQGQRFEAGGRAERGLEPSPTHPFVQQAPPSAPPRPSSFA